MPSEIESRRFVACDASGNQYVVVAKRDVILAIGGAERLGPWRFHLEDGRLVRPNHDFGSYTVDQGGIRLTTVDPNEPTD